MTPTPAELREAAEFVSRHQMFVRDCKHLYNAHQQCQWCHSDRYYIESARIAGYILSHFPADGAEPITADWLREEWGWEQAKWSSRVVMESGRSAMTKGKNEWFYEDDDLTWPKDLTTRQQFRMLAGLLGIEPKRKESK